MERTFAFGGINGSEKTTPIQRRARRSCRSACSNRVIGGCVHRDQHGCCRRDIGISAALPIGSKALLVNAQREQGCRGSLILSLQVKARKSLTIAPGWTLNAPALLRDQNNGHRNNLVSSVRRSGGDCHRESLRMATGRSLRPLYSTDRSTLDPLTIWAIRESSNSYATAAVA
jgi:hypothetical protein